MERILVAQQHVLFIEDDHRLRELTANYLRQHGFHVTDKESGEDAINFLRTYDVDLIILDIMLPGINGFQLAKLFMQSYSGPLLFLTAKTELNDELQGFEIGADDYITKPVEPSVLLARINALMRRSHSSETTSQKVLNFGRLQLNSEARSVSLNEQNIELTSHEFDLLLMLAENAGKTVQRETIYQKIIGREYDGLDRSADVRVSRLRKKLGDNAQQPFRIKTIWGKGFFFVANAWE